MERLTLYANNGEVIYQTTGKHVIVHHRTYAEGVVMDERNFTIQHAISNAQPGEAQVRQQKVRSNAIFVVEEDV